MTTHDDPAEGAAGVVIVGAGFAGGTLALTLRVRGYTGRITMIGAEAEPPYNRPPLSKGYLKDGGPIDPVLLRPVDFWAENDIALVAGARAVHLDRVARTVFTDAGHAILYDHLVLATGARPRPLPLWPEAPTLRTWADAVHLRARLAEAGDGALTIVGGGFIGLELAAAVTGTREVRVVEAAPRLLQRALSPVMADHLAAEHERHGVRFHLGHSIVAGDPDGRGLVVLDDGTEFTGALAVVGIGVLPDVGLAAAAGLAVDNGVVVDEQLRTADERISAIGDCASFPCAITGRRLRLESVQNAGEQARHLAARLAGDDPGPFRAVPWFWSEQYGRRYLIAGVAPSDSAAELDGDPGTEAFAVRRVDETGRLLAVESVGLPQTHAAARKALAAGA